MSNDLHKQHRERVRKEFLENGFSDSTSAHKFLELLLFTVFRERTQTKPLTCF